MRNLNAEVEKVFVKRWIRYESVDHKGVNNYLKKVPQKGNLPKRKNVKIHLPAKGIWENWRKSFHSFLKWQHKMKLKCKVGKRTRDFFSWEKDFSSDWKKKFFLSFKGKCSWIYLVIFPFSLIYGVNFILYSIPFFLKYPWKSISLEGVRKSQIFLLPWFSLLFVLISASGLQG